MAWIDSFTIAGLILSIIGTIKLIEPFILGNKAILKLSSYEDSGAILGMGTVTKYNQEAINNFTKSRNKAFEGISFIFVGFTFQLIPVIIKFIASFFNRVLSLKGILIFSMFILIVDIFILRAMNKRKEQLSSEVEVI